MNPLRIGTRGSALALWQANHVAHRLRSLGRAIDIVEIETTGDRVNDQPLSQLGGDGAFTKEIQRALLDRRIDIAVHSLKDLPTFAVDGLILAAVPERGPTGDAFVSRKHVSFESLPSGARVATSSLRRRALMLHRRPDLNMVPMRGNVETRLRKLDEQDLDALVLAEAGLERLGLSERITEVLDPAWMMPAIGQGALGIECRADDKAVREILAHVDHEITRACALAERALLRGLGGGCQVPIAGTARFDGEIINLRGVVVTVDGSEILAGEQRGPVRDPESLGTALAEELLSRGAARLLALR